MIMTMPELLYVRLLINQYNIFYDDRFWSIAQGDMLQVMGPDLAHNRSSQPQYC